MKTRRILTGLPRTALTAFIAFSLAIPASAQSPSKGDALSISQEEIGFANERATLFSRLREKLFGNDYNIAPNDDENVKQLKTFMRKRSFSSWLRFNSELTRGLSKEAQPMRGLVKPVRTAQEGYLAKLMMVRQAKYSVDLAYYIFSAKDEAGLALVNELKAAIARGVNIRILVDGLGSMEASLRGNPHFKALLLFAREHGGFVRDPATGKATTLRASVQIAVFNPPTNLAAPLRSVLRMGLNSLRKDFANNPSTVDPVSTTGWSLNRRMHDKILIADAEFPELAVAISGGRNISNHYYGFDPEDPTNFRDLEVIIKNDPANLSVNQPDRQIGEVINEHYDRLYFHLGNRLLSEGIVGKAFGREKEYAKLDEATDKVSKLTTDSARQLGEDFASPDFGKKYLSTGFFDQEVNLLTTVENLARSQKEFASIRDGLNNPKDLNQILREQEATSNGRALMARVTKLLVREKEAVTVVSPYLYITLRDIVVIKAWLKQDSRRRFSVYTNSVVTSDNPPAQAHVDLVTGPRLMQDPDISAQVKVYEYARLDDQALGGTKPYGKLHFKGAYFKSQRTSLVVTHNKDPRSQIINSESGFDIAGPEYAAVMEGEIADIHGDSHLWGSDEYLAIRTHPKLTTKQKFNVKHQGHLLWLLETLNLWWMV